MAAEIGDLATRCTDDSAHKRVAARRERLAVRAADFGEQSRHDATNAAGLVACGCGSLDRVAALVGEWPAPFAAGAAPPPTATIRRDATNAERGAGTRALGRRRLPGACVGVVCARGGVGHRLSDAATWS